MMKDLAKAERLQKNLTKSYAKLIREGWSPVAARDELDRRMVSLVQAKTGIRDGFAGFASETAMLWAEVAQDAKRLT